MLAHYGEYSENYHLYIWAGSNKIHLFKAEAKDIRQKGTNIGQFQYI